MHIFSIRLAHTLKKEKLQSGDFVADFHAPVQDTLVPRPQDILGLEVSDIEWVLILEKEVKCSPSPIKYMNLELADCEQTSRQCTADSRG